MFPVAALIIKSFSLFSSIEKIHCLTREFHAKFYAKNQYCMNHKAMSNGSVPKERIVGVTSSTQYEQLLVFCFVVVVLFHSPFVSVLNIGPPGIM